MAVHRVLVLRASDGQPLEELPAADLRYSEVLTGMGNCSFTLPLSHPKAARTLIGPSYGREVAVIRDDTTCVFNGPITTTVRDLDQASVTVTARDPGWYLTRRFTDSPANYKREPFAIVRSLVQKGTTGKPNGALPRFYVSQNSSGYGNVNFLVGSTERTPIMQAIGDLADDDAHPFDYKWVYTYSRANVYVDRTLSLAVSHGTEHLDLTLTSQAGLTVLQDTESIETATNRVQVLGASVGKARKRATATNSASLNAGLPLLELPLDRTNVKDQAHLNGIASTYRRLLAPSVRDFQTEHVTSQVLPARSLLLGDTVRVQVMSGGEQIDERRRVVQIATTVDEGGEERVTLTYNSPTDVTVV